jgi:hypothetical protein
VASHLQQIKELGVPLCGLSTDKRWALAVCKISTHRFLLPSFFTSSRGCVNSEGPGRRQDTKLDGRTVLSEFSVNNLPVPVAARSKALMILGRSSNAIVGSNSARVMDVCPRLSEFCCPVEAEFL